MTSRNSLSDDWEDVGEDNLSVISFSTAEPDADVAPTSSKSDDSSMPAELDAAQNETSLQRPATPTPEPPPQTSSQPQEAGEDENNDVALAHELYRSEQQNPFDEEVDEINQLLEESTFPGEVDPVLLQSTLESLRDILEDTTHGLTDIVIGLSDRARWKTLEICDLLSKQVAELLPISAGYAKVWSGSTQDLPIDPNLHGWLTGVRVKILSLKAEIQAISRSSPDASPSNLITLWHELEVYGKQMVDFLPIIQVDFNEFQTQYMNIPIASAMSADSSAQGGLRGMAIDRSDPIDIPQPNSGAPSPSYSGEFPRDPRNQVWLLRHELYRLKDLIKQTREKLSNKLGLSDSGSALARDISATYKRLYNTLEAALSNHGSDWIDSGLAGGLTYPEFLGLDADCIRDFSCQLRLTMDELPRDSKEAWSSEWGTQLESLEILAMVLSATLSPSRD